MSDWSRWSNKRDMKHSFSGFLSEAGSFMSGDPKEIAMQKGWKPDNFGWYRDGTGNVVARSIGGKMVVYDGNPNTNLPSQTDMGNPAVTAGQKPAERARTMGLQSNGKGGYVDDSGQVVARTVNGELVFYDGNGGAVTDGAGGKDMVMSQPSWVDPDTGLIMVPPAQPETPEELAATPDPLPATPPMGFDLFVKQKHKQMKADIQAQRQAEADVQQKEQEVEEKYNDEGPMNNVYLLSKAAMEKAEQTGDEDKMETVGHMNDVMDEYAESMKVYFENIPPELHEGLPREVFRELVKKSKMRSKYGNNDEQFNPEKVITSLNDVFQKNYPKENLKPTSRVEPGESEVEGKLITYSLLAKDGAPKGVTLPTNKGGPQQYIDNAYEDAKTTIDVEWMVKDDIKGDDKRQNRLAALEALKMWRDKILPSLPEGVILQNDPSDDAGGQRRRIYDMAGFGSEEEEDGKLTGKMRAFVTKDEEGNNVLMPIGYQAPRRGIEEAYVNYAFMNLNITEREVVSEMLFG